MAKLSKTLVAALLVAALVVPVASSMAASPKAGAKCSKVNVKVVTAAKVTLQCKKKSGKLVWVKIKSAPVVTPTPEPTPTTTPTPEPTPTTPAGDTADYLDNPAVTTLQLYTGGAGPSAGGGGSVTLGVTPPSDYKNYNVRLWVYDPENPKQSSGAPGFFVKPAGGEWKFVGTTSNSLLVANWTPGAYSVDTVEPGGNSRKYSRRNYTIVVATDNTVTIDGLTATAEGFFALTLGLAEVNKNAYNPTAPCQLKTQVEEAEPMVRAGFPRSTVRLPHTGVVRALIVPVDFTDVPGETEPATEFFSMAKGVHDYFAKQSGGRVHFDFKIVKNWQRQSFASNKYELGKWSGGDAGGYFSALIRQADPLVDFSQFDAVYFLSPPTIPWSSIAYGPALPRFPTGDGVTIGGSFSGADAYSNNGTRGARWKWMAHETGHLFGLQDLYTNGVDATFGWWELMSMNWSNAFIELTAWNRYISGWLTDSQIACLTPATIDAAGTTVLIEPIERDSTDKIKAVAIPLSSSKILVVESRRAEGLDNTASDQAAGTLVYTVDMTIATIKGAWHTIMPARATDGDTFKDAALRVGETVEVDGYVIKVVSQTADGDTVLVTKK
jgi:M6 family metalloprotease-like protein